MELKRSDESALFFEEDESFIMAASRVQDRDGGMEGRRGGGAEGDEGRSIRT